jgi:hypothetical protein
MVSAVGSIASRNARIGTYLLQIAASFITSEGVNRSAGVAVGSHSFYCLRKGSRTTFAKTYVGEQLVECWLARFGSESSQEELLQ